VWQQILADVFDADIALINSTEGGAMGVALLAGVGAGVWNDTREACDATLRVVKRVAPTRDAALRRRYDALYSRFRALYPALEAEFAALSALSETK
jgi:xylulokinase